MSERTMTDEHKSAIAAGRNESKAISAYLEAMESNRPRAGRPQTVESLTAKLNDISVEMSTAKTMQRLELMQRRRDIEARIEEMQATPDMSALEQGFVDNARSYSERKGITYSTWREFGVAAELLARAGINRTRS